MNISSPFYVEALEGISKLNTWKHFSDINLEHVFFNPIFTTTIDDEIHDRTITPFLGNNILSKITTYGNLIESVNTVIETKLKRAILRKIESIDYIRPNVEAHAIEANGKEYVFKNVTQKLIYDQLLREQSRLNAYHTKWTFEREEFGAIFWDEIWANIHSQFRTEEIKSCIWEQIRLNLHNF